MPVVSIVEALNVIRSLVALIEASHTSGQPIPAADFDAAVAARNAALSQLDADIAVAKGEGR